MKTRSNLDQYVMDLADAHVRADGGAVPIAETRAAIRDSVRAFIASNDRDIDAETDRALISITRSERGKRRSIFRKEIDWICDYFDDPDSGAIGIESVLDLSFPLGREDGADKTLRYWTREDLVGSISVRREVAREAAVAADEHELSVKRLIDRMDAAGVATVGGLI